MSILSRKYPFQPSSSWMVESLRNCAVVFLILYFLQPFGFSAYEGNKFLASFLFGAVTFLCCLAFRFLVFIPLQKYVRPWRIWHEVLTVLLMVLFIGICNFFLAVWLFEFPLSWGLFLMFLYWALVVGVIVGGVSTAVSYSRHLRGQLDTLLDKTTEAQAGLSVTLHDTRVRGNDLTLPINDLLYIEAQKNNVAVCYLLDGEVERAERGQVGSNIEVFIAQQYRTDRLHAPLACYEGEVAFCVRDAAVERSDDEDVHAHEGALVVADSTADGGLCKCAGRNQQRGKEKDQLRFHVAKMDTEKHSCNFCGPTASFPDG